MPSTNEDSRRIIETTGLHLGAIPKVVVWHALYVRPRAEYAAIYLKHPLGVASDFESVLAAVKIDSTYEVEEDGDQVLAPYPA